MPVPRNVVRKLGNYVYLLVNPLDGTVFRLMMFETIRRIAPALVLLTSSKRGLPFSSSIWLAPIGNPRENRCSQIAQDAFCPDGRYHDYPLA